MGKDFGVALAEEREEAWILGVNRTRRREWASLFGARLCAASQGNREMGNFYLYSSSFNTSNAQSARSTILGGACDQGSG